MKSPRKWWRDLQRTRLAAKLLKEALGDDIRLRETEGITAYIRLQHREIRNLQASRCRAKLKLEKIRALCRGETLAHTGHARSDKLRVGQAMMAAEVLRVLDGFTVGVRLSMADRATPAIERTIAKLSEPEVQA